MCEKFNLDPKYREYIFNVLYSVFLCPVFRLSALCEDNPFMDFASFAEITKTDVQKAKYDWMLNHE